MVPWLNVFDSSIIVVFQSTDNFYCDDTSGQLNVVSGENAEDSQIMLQPPLQLAGTSVSADIVASSNAPEAASSSESAVPSRGRKRRSDPSMWKQNIRKRMRNSGQAYTAFSGKPVDRRQLKMHTCGQCSNHCNERLPKELREEIFSKYWGMNDYSRQRDFICNHVLKKKTSNAARRSANFAYFFTVGQQQIQVCKQVFLATLNVGERTVRYALDHTDGHGNSRIDKRGKHAPGIKKLPEQRQAVRDHIASFPALESHYTRARSAKKYLEATLNVRKMYELYKQQCADRQEEPVLESYYRSVFTNDFNLSFHQPKKDFCCFCQQYANSTDEERQKLLADYNAHHKRKVDARNAKEKYKAEAQEDKSMVVATFDLQAVLPSPKLNASAVYYKRKLSTYNLTVYSLADHDCTCYMWHEGTAGRGSSDIASCMLKYLTDLPKETSRVVLFSDTCSGQNRNQFFCSMIVYALHNSNIQQLDHLYMESGHSQMECDSVHACIERAVRKMSINAPTDYYAAVANARNPQYKVVCMDRDDFQDFNGLTQCILRNRTKDTNKNKVNWLKIKHFRYLKQKSSEIYFKYDTDTDNQSFHTLVINQGNRGRRPVAIPTSLSPLYTGPVNISSAKYRDLLALCDSKIIKSDYHPFYQSLSVDDKIDDCLPETDVEDVCSADNVIEEGIA